MRILIISRAGAVAPPMEIMPDLLQAFKAWRDKWRSKMEAFEFFAGGPGGWGVFNATDERELSQAMMEYPLASFSHLEAHPTTSGDEALERLIDDQSDRIATNCTLTRAVPDRTGASGCRSEEKKRIESVGPVREDRHEVWHGA